MARKWHLWPALETPEDAAQDLAFTAKAFYAIAGLQLVFLAAVYAFRGVFSADFFDPLFMAACALAMTRKHSRIAAIILTGYALLIIVGTFLSRIGAPLEGSYGGRNMFLALLLLYISLRAWRASRLYHNLARTVIHWRRGWSIFGIAFLYVLVIATAIITALILLLDTDKIEMTAEMESLLGGLVLVPIVAVFFFAGWRKLPGTRHMAVVLPASQAAMPKERSEDPTSASTSPALDGFFHGPSVSAVSDSPGMAGPLSTWDSPAASESVAKAERPAGGYFIRHWRGELSLARSFWVNVVAINMAWVAPFFALNALEDLLSLRLLAIGHAALATSALALYFWQFVGCWRSANAHVRRSGRWGWARAAQVALILGAAQTAFSSFPVAEESIAIATGLDPYNKFTIQRIGNNEVAINGRLGTDAPEELRKFLEILPEIEWIHLNSDGGRLGAARELARMIEQYGLNTYTETGCKSACFIAFMAGDQRVLNTKAKIGLHAYHMRGASYSWIKREINKDRRYFIERGVSPRFLDTAFATSPRKIWYPSLDELVRAGVITHSLDGKMLKPVR